MKNKDSDLCINEFFEAFKDVVPIKNDDRVLTSNRTNLLSKQLKRQALEKHHTLSNNYLLTSALPPLDPYDHISYRQDGVQQGVFKNLRLGKYAIDSVIQLQNIQFEVARQRIFEQVLHQHQKGARCILIKHGLGLNNKPYPGFLKTYVNTWLLQLEEVLAFHSALPKHGGNGGTYVLLKKNASEKAKNREEHSKR